MMNELNDLRDTLAQVEQLMETASVSQYGDLRRAQQKLLCQIEQIEWAARYN